MTEKEIEYFRERKQIKSNLSKDWLFLLLAISWFLTARDFIEYAFNLLDKSQTLLFFISVVGMLLVTFVFVISIRLRAGVSRVKKNPNFNLNQLLNTLKYESWSVTKQADDLILVETGTDSIIILIDKDTIFFNSRPNSIRPFANFNDWKLKERLSEILMSA